MTSWSAFFLFDCKNTNNFLQLGSNNVVLKQKYLEMMRVSSNLRILIIISDDECLKVTLYQNNIMSPLEKVRALSTKS